MYKKLTHIGAALAMSAALFAPAAALAGLTSGQVQAVIGLLQSLGVDQATIDNVSGALTGNASSGTSAAASCVSLSYNLYAGSTDGSTNGDVSRLQQYLGISPTGYFGPVTEQAVQQWQSGHGVVSSGSPDTTGYGFVGPQTRNSMACAGAPVVTSQTQTQQTQTQSVSNYQTQPVVAQIAFDQASLTTSYPNPVISGIAQGVTQVRVDIYGHQSATAVVTNGTWKVQVNDGLSYGVYSIQAVDLSTGAVLASGALRVTGSATQSVYTPTTGINGTTNMSGVSTAGATNTTATGPAPSATLNPISLGITGPGIYGFAGSAQNTQSVTVYVLPYNYMGARDYNSVTNAANGKVVGQYVYAPVQNPIPVQGGNWSAAYQVAPPSGSMIVVFDTNTHALLTYGYVNGSAGSYGGENGGAGSGGGAVSGGGNFDGPSPAGSDPGSSASGGPAGGVNF